MYTFFPEYAPGITDPRRRKITIRHLLTMTPGFSRGDGLWHMEFDFKQLIVFEPGEKPAYNRSASHLLSGIITKSTNMSTLQFADKYLFKPLGIPTPRWRTGFGGYNQGGWGLYMTTRDMAKIGYLYLRNGVWDGRQIIPKKWVKESTQKHSSNPIESISSVEIDYAYGYQWWVITPPEGHPVFVALGFGGQFIYVYPYRNFVAVMSSDTHGDEQQQHMKIFLLFIVPSVID
jgi:CubicO group peptidase (beta-lactamase class C family)